jgi:transcriptional regulator with XRE-family HTH domain
MALSKTKPSQCIGAVLAEFRREAGWTQRQLTDRISRLHSEKTLVNRVVRTVLVEMRSNARLTQRQLAARCKRCHSWIAKIESGDRQLFVHEIFPIAHAIGIPPEQLFRRMERGFKKARLSGVLHSRRSNRRISSPEQAAWISLLASYHIHRKS